MLEGCRRNGVEHLVFASSSSVYGANTALPFSVHQNVDHPVEPLRRLQEGERADGAHVRASLPPAGDRLALLHGVRSLGAAGHGIVPVHAQNSRRRADRRVQRGTPRARFHLHRRHRRGRACARPTESRRPTPTGAATIPSPATSNAPYRLYNIGNNNPVELMHFIACIEKALGRRGQEEFSAACNPATCRRRMPTSTRSWPTSGFKPATPIEDGIAQFIAWYRSYYG